MATTGFSSANHHSVADHADLTAPNSDWFRLCICRPDSAMSSGADIVSTAEYGIANSFNIYAFDNAFGLKVNALGDLNVTYTNGNWYLLCAQRSGTTLSFRVVEMGTTTVNSDSGGTLSSAVNASTTMRFGRRSDTGANPFDGGISDVMFVNGQTISDSDLQDIATGTPIDSFAWYSSRVFWGILENQTASDETGDHTITEEGTLSTTADPVDLVRFGEIIVAVGQALETDTALSIFSENQAAEYSSGNYHSIPDSPGMTLPNTDWTWLLTFKTGSDVATAQDVFINGVYHAANVLDLYIFSSSFGLDISNLGADETIACSADTWYLLAITRSSNTFTLRAIPFGSGTVSESAGNSISAAYDSSSGYHFGQDEAGSFPQLGGAIGDALFLPGEAVSNADLVSIAEDNDALEDFSWYSSREFHLIAAKGLDDTGNHTVSTTGTPVIVPGPPGFKRLSTSINVDADQVNETSSAFGLTWTKTLSFGQSLELSSAQAITSLKETDVPLANEVNSSLIINPDFASKIATDTAIESNTSQVITPFFPFTVFGMAHETNTAQVFTGQRIFTMGQVLEVDIALSNSTTKILGLELPSESSSSFAFDFFKILSLQVAAEIDSGVVIQRIGGAIDPLPVDNSGVRFLIDDRIKTSTITATSTAAGFDRNNLKLDDKTAIWRSTSLATQTLTFSWASQQLLSGVALIFSNLIVGSTVRLRIFANSSDIQAIFQTPIMTVDFAYDPPHGFSSIGYLSFPFGGGNYFSIFFPEALIGKIELDLTSVGNPDNAIELGRLVAGPTLALASRPDYGASVAQEDRTKNARSTGGDIISSRGTQSKKLQLPLAKLTRGDSSLYNNIMRGIGRDIPIFISVQGDDFTSEDITSYQIYGQKNRNLSKSPISHNRNSSNITITEI